ncbi:alpha/beta hydrolase [Chloroflexia bacterium SDU3-3]|nr:alpha/beta hydrolase [Chloroflexia bacterium SDU3-3]
MSQGYVDCGGGRMYYEVAGEGAPVVLCHAGFVDSRMWDDQWAALAQRCRVIRFDMRGFVRSAALDGPVCRRADLYALLEQLGVGPAVLVGCSLGGELALDAALERPELASALILVSAVPSGFAMAGAPPSELLQMIDALGRGDLGLAEDLQMQLWMAGQGRTLEQVDAEAVRRARAMARVALANGTWQQADISPLDPLDPPAAARLGQLARPALVIAGALDHPEVLRAAGVLADGIPVAQQVVMGGCAHVPNMEQPELFSRHIFSFLQQHDFLL